MKKQITQILLLIYLKQIGFEIKVSANSSIIPQFTPEEQDKIIASGLKYLNCGMAYRSNFRTSSGTPILTYEELIGRYDESISNFYLDSAAFNFLSVVYSNDGDRATKALLGDVNNDKDYWDKAFEDYDKLEINLSSSPKT